jgi:hypothetical protein
MATTRNPKRRHRLSSDLAVAAMIHNGTPLAILDLSKGDFFSGVNKNSTAKSYSVSRIA